VCGHDDIKDDFQHWLPNLVVEVTQLLLLFMVCRELFAAINEEAVIIHNHKWRS